MSKTFFTSDWHLGEDRIGINGKPNLFYRPFKSVLQQDNAIIAGFMDDGFEDGDTLYHLGDVLYKGEESENWLKSIRRVFPTSKLHLIIGNYDEAVDKIAILSRYFDTLEHEKIIELNGKEYYLNHYPSKCIDAPFAITGHIHGLWKVQKNMINVGVDAWYFKPVSEEQLAFCENAVRNHYDNNVFPY